MNRPKKIGTWTESAFTGYAVGNGFPFAERLALHGALDEADVTLCPGAVAEVKGGNAAETASDLDVTRWLAEAEAERRHRGADVCLLVLKRKGKGAASVGQWWAVLPGWAIHMLGETASQFVFTQVVVDGLNVEEDESAHYRRCFGATPPVRMTVADAVTLLRRAGYGDPIIEEAA